MSILTPRPFFDHGNRVTEVRKMKADLSRAPVQERYQHLLTVIGSERFLRKQGLGNETPFFIRVSFDKAWLADESDVDKCLQQMREALLKAIREGKRIQI